MAVRRREPGGLRLNLANGLGFLAVFLVVGRWEPAGGSLRSPLYALYARAERNGRAFSVGWTSPRPVGRGPARPVGNGRVSDGVTVRGGRERMRLPRPSGLRLVLNAGNGGGAPPECRVGIEASPSLR